MIWKQDCVCIREIQVLILREMETLEEHRKNDSEINGKRKSEWKRQNERGKKYESKWEMATQSARQQARRGCGLTGSRRKVASMTHVARQPHFQPYPQWGLPDLAPVSFPAPVAVLSRPSSTQLLALSPVPVHALTPVPPLTQPFFPTTLNLNPSWFTPPTDCIIFVSLVEESKLMMESSAIINLFASVVFTQQSISRSSW